jgi:hypothetical protein
LPVITILRSKGGLGDIGKKDAQRVVRDAMASLSDVDRVRLSHVEIWLVPGTQDMTPVVRLLPQGANIKLGLAKNGHFFIPRGGE